MYPQVFSAAQEVDRAFLIIFGFSVFILVAVTIAMLFFLWRYHHKRNPEPTDIKGSVLLEIIWTGLPTIIVLGLFWTGWTSFKAMRTIPDDAMVVQAEGRMWSWRFTYENGKSSADLVVPVNTAVKLELSARDVIHSFYIPAMRVKWDMVPGMETDAWFQSDKTGEFDIFCAEYCGLKHANMLAILRVVEPEEYETWLEEAERPGPLGFKLLEEHGCFDCHSMDISEDVGPTLMDINEKKRLVLTQEGDEKEVMVNEAYLKQSILNPGALIVKGWDDEMPSYEGEIPEEDIDVMVQYILAGETVHPGEILAEQEGCMVCHTATGEEDVGPTFKGLFLAKRPVRDAKGNARSVVADEEYLLQSIVDPSTLVTEEYEDEMPIYDELDEETLTGLVGYIMSLGEKGNE